MEAVIPVRVIADVSRLQVSVEETGEQIGWRTVRSVLLFAEASSGLIEPLEQ